MASAPSVPTGLATSSVTSSTVDLVWNQASNSGSSWATMGWTGVAYGYYPSGGGKFGGSGDTVLNHESQMGRQTSIVKIYSDFKSTSWLSGSDDVSKMCNGGKLSSGETVSGGRTPYIALEACLYSTGGGVFAGMPQPDGSTSAFGGSQTNDCYTYLQIGQVDLAGNVTRAGTCDAILSAFASHIKAYGKPVLWTLTHEVDDATYSGQGTNTRAAASLRMTPVRTTLYNTDGSVKGYTWVNSTNPHWDEYAAAIRYVVKFFNDAGATNHVAMQMFSGYRGTSSGSAGRTLYQSAWPGSAWVDVIGWEPYAHSSPAYSGTSPRLSTLLAYGGWYSALDANFLDAGSGALPRALGEFGAMYRTDGSRASVFFANFATDLQAYPKVKMVDYFARGAWGDLHTNVSGTWDSASLAQLKTSLATSYLNPNTSTSGSGVGGYKVYEGTSVLSTVTPDSTSPTAHLTGLSAGSSHSFTVSSFDTSTTPLESAKSAALSVTLPTTTIPTLPAPVPFTVAPAPNPPQVTFSWGAVSGASAYHMQRSTDAGPYGQNASMTAGQLSFTSTLLTTGHVYTFRLATVNSAGVEGPWSTVLTVDTTGTVQPIGPPSGPGASVATVTGSSSSQVTLTWQASTDSRVIEYWVYRDNDPSLDSTVTPTVRVASSTLTWVDPVLKRPGETHTYFILAADASSPAVLSSAVSLVVSANVASNGAPIASLAVSSTALTLPTDGSGVVFLLDASASSDPNNDPLTFTFTVNDGQSAVGPQTTPTIARRVYSPGIYTATVLVADPSGATDRVSQTVTVSPPAGLVTPNLQLPLPLNNQSYGPAGTAQAKSYWQQQTLILTTLDQPKLPSFTTANRPVSPLAGWVVLDTTLGKPIVFDGSVWRDFAGTSV